MREICLTFGWALFGGIGTRTIEITMGAPYAGMAFAGVLLLMGVGLFNLEERRHTRT